MVKVHDEGAFRVYIYAPPREHQPPHVHVECTRGGELVVRLGGEGVAASIWLNHHIAAAMLGRPFGSSRRSTFVS